MFAVSKQLFTETGGFVSQCCSIYVYSFKHDGIELGELLVTTIHRMCDCSVATFKKGLNFADSLTRTCVGHSLKN